MEAPELVPEGQEEASTCQSLLPCVGVPMLTERVWQNTLRRRPG